MGRTPFPARSLLLRRKYYLPGIVLRGETRGPWSSASLLPSGCLALFVFLAFFFFSFFFGLIVLIKSFCPVLFFTRLTMLRSAQRCFLCFWPGAGLHGAWLPVVSCRHGDSRPGGLHWGGEGVTWLTSPGEEARVRGPVGVEWGPGRQAVAEPGALLRGDSQAGKGRNALTFFREVNKVREYGWDPVYLTPAPQGTRSQCRTTHWNRTSQTSGARGPGGKAGRR